MNLKELVIELVNAETENEVITILDKKGLWDAEDYWVPLGNRPNNFGIISSQSESPDRALVEKLVNSIDSLMELECRKHGIDPEGPGAPQSMKEATEMFFNIPNGDLTNLTSKERTQLAENIGLMVTGKLDNPSYSIFDFGVGQSPTTMPSTILSIGESNKDRIMFVQGIYNQGGTAVLPFCSPRHHLQLIISRQHEIVQSDNDLKSNQWSFTVVRREDPKPGERTYKYTYLAPAGVLSFPADSLPILPSKYPDKTGDDMGHGTFIKLYEYQITPKHLKEIINLRLNFRLASLLPGTFLPIRLYERRNKVKEKYYETTLSGLLVRLNEDARGNLEPNFPVNGIVKVDGQPFSYKIFAFKKDARITNYKSNESIIFTYIGQNHGYENTSIFQRKILEPIKYIAKHVLVIVDCSKLSNAARADFFMASRDRMRKGLFYERVLKRLLIEISKNKELSELKHRRLCEDTIQKLKDDKPLTELLQEVINSDPTLSEIFNSGRSRLHSPLQLSSGREVIHFNGQRYPNFFNINHNFPSKSPKRYFLNNKVFRVQFETDAENEYFNRIDDPGTQKLYVNGTEVDTYTLNLNNGHATLNVEQTDERVAGQIARYELIVNDRTQLQPFKNEFFVEVKKGRSNNGDNNGNRKNPTNIGPGKLNNLNTLNLPHIVRVDEDGWNPDNQFTQFDALYIKDGGKEGLVFFINVANLYLQRYLVKRPAQVELNKRIYELALVILAMQVIKEARNRKESKNPEIEACRVLKYIAPVLLSVIFKLSKLKLESRKSYQLEY